MTQQDHKHTPITPQEKYNIAILYILYVIQGLPIGFFAGAIPVLLAEKGATFQQLGELSLCIYPFALKFITAPLLDTYYIKSFGQRKTYIVPLQYLFGILAIFSSYHIQEYIDNFEVGYITILGFICCFLMAQQDVAVDGWVLTMLSEDHVGIGSTCNNLGQLTGIFISNIFFIQLNSVKFCNSYIYSTEQVVPVLTAQTFLTLVGIVTIVLTAYVHFLVKEKNAKPDDHEHSIWEVVSCLKGFLTNKNLRFFVIFLCTYKLGFSPISATFGLELVKEGYEKETLANISTLMMPLTFLVAIAASKIVKKGTEMKFTQLCFVLRIFSCLFTYAVLKSFPHIQNEYIKEILVLITQITETCVVNFNFIAMGSFFNRISDIDVGGSYLTVLNSISNLGGQNSDSLALYLVGTFQYDTVIICGFVFCVIYFLVIKRKWKSLQDVSKQDWKLSKIKEKV